MSHMFEYNFCSQYFHVESEKNVLNKIFKFVNLEMLNLKLDEARRNWCKCVVH